MKITNAWYPPSLPTRIVVQAPSGDLMHFDQVPFREVQESELAPYKGYTPSRQNAVPEAILRHYGMELIEHPDRIPVIGAWRSVQDTGVIYLKMPDGTFCRAKLREAEPRVCKQDLRPDNSVDPKSWHDLFEVELCLYDYFNLSKVAES